MGDAVHPEDRKNTTYLAAARRGSQVELTWPDDLATARYLWRKLGFQITEADFTGDWAMGDDEFLGVEVIGGNLCYVIPSDLKLARYLWTKLDGALTDTEWKLYVQATEMRAKLEGKMHERVQLAPADAMPKRKPYRFGAGR